MIKHLKAIKWAMVAMDSALYWSSVIFIGRENFFSFSSRGVMAYGFIYLILILGLYAFKGYDQAVIANGKKDTAIRITSAVVVSAVFAVGMVVLFLPFYELRPLRFLKAVALCGITMPLVRMLAGAYIKGIFPSKRCIVIGSSAKWSPLMKEISQSLSRKLIPTAYCEGTSDAIRACLEKRHRSTVIIVAEERALDDQDMVKTLKNSGLTILYLPNLAETALKRIPMELLDSYSSYYSVSFQAIASRPVERSFNLATATAISLVLGPIALISAIAIAVNDGFPVLFKQKRTGKDGEKFTIYKFRTMAQAPEGCHGDPEQDCQRLTKTGRIIRKLRLDEIPQLINVIKGDMNLVGPRPEIDRFIEMCSGNIPFYDERHRIKPGITGWAQVKYKYTSDLNTYRDKTEYDLYYVKNQNILLDLTIILATIGTMVGMKGAK